VDAELAPLGVIYEFAEVEGEPARAIERLAAAGGADAIVVGRSRSPHALLGSVAGRLVRNANRPVIVVP
jgi:nucleotide-binding universal stress UspA family protein